tara:strand:+ start:554 stop:739 length:186 start_codon:yes stop_codon:yes gene_type:complete
MIDIEERRAYYRQYYRNNKDKYKLNEEKTISNKPINTPSKSKQKKIKPYFKITKEQCIIEF